MKTVRFLVATSLITAAWFAGVFGLAGSFGGLHADTQTVLSSSHPSSLAYQQGARATDSRIAAAEPSR